MSSNTVPFVTLYTKAECSLCEKAKEILKTASREIPFHYEEIDITKNPVYFEQFKDQIPVIFINKRKAFKYRVEPKNLLEKLHKCR